MGWKSTIDISREEAERLIAIRMMVLSHLTNREIEELLMSLGFGDEPELAHYGHNFNII